MNDVDEREYFHLSTDIEKQDQEPNEEKGRHYRAQIMRLRESEFLQIIYQIVILYLTALCTEMRLKEILHALNY